MLGNFIFWRKITKNLKNVKETLKKPQITYKKIRTKIFRSLEEFFETVSINFELKVTIFGLLGAYKFRTIARWCHSSDEQLLKYVKLKR